MGWGGAGGGRKASAHLSAVSGELSAPGEDITQGGGVSWQRGVRELPTDMTAAGEDSNFIGLVQRRQNPANMSLLLGWAK